MLHKSAWVVLLVGLTSEFLGCQPSIETAGVCPSLVERCQDLSTWCNTGIYMWPRRPHDIAEFGKEPDCFCMCESDADCDISRIPSVCGILHDKNGDVHFPYHVWFDVQFDNGLPMVCLTSEVTAAPMPSTCK